MTRWQARHAALATEDDDEWERLHDAFSTDWQAAYTRAFVRIAVDRGWKREDAASWPEHIADDALAWTAPKHAWSPQRTARADVINCEMECG
jgi:hypothetical protein